MILDLLYLILFTSIFTITWKIVTADQMLLEDFGKEIQYQIDEKRNKRFELLNCPFCIPQWAVFPAWGVVVAFELIPMSFDWRYLLLHILSVCGSSIVSGFAWSAYTTMNARRDKYEAETEHFSNIKKYYSHLEELSHYEIRDRKEAYHFKKQHNNIKSY